MPFKKYLIKLDDFDVKYFLNHYFLSETTTPIWSVKNLNRRTLEDDFIFKIEGWKRPDVAGKPPSFNNETENTHRPKHTCIICNVEVPKLYKPEDRVVSKDEIHLRIANAALTGAAGATTVNKQVDSDLDSNGICFCKICAGIVKEIDTQHVTKTCHKSILYDRLYDLVYEDGQYSDEADFDYIMNNHFYNEDVPNNDFTAKYENNEFNECINDSDNESADNNNNDGKTSNEVDKTKRFEINRNDSNKNSDVESNIITVTTPENYKFRVSFENYNGLYTCDKQTVCRCCRVILREPTDKHILKSAHVENMKIPLENMHCFRRIDAVFNHCILCNEVLCASQTSTHTCLKSHIINLIRAVNVKDSLGSTQNNPSDLTGTLASLIQNHLIPSKYSPDHQTDLNAESIHAIPFEMIPLANGNHFHTDPFAAIMSAHMFETNVKKADTAESDPNNVKSHPNESKLDSVGMFNTERAAVQDSNRERSDDEKDSFKFFSHCDICETNVVARDLAKHKKSRQHAKNVKLIRKPKAVKKGKTVRKYLNTVEMSLVAVDIKLGAVETDPNVFEANLRAVDRISVQIERILARLLKMSELFLEGSDADSAGVRKLRLP